MADLLIQNARVIDGTGADSFQADILVSRGIITQVDPVIDMVCPKTINGAGLVVCPGFIDMHTHSDFSLLLEPLAESRVRQGVTTEVTGNCGGSPAPVLCSGQDAFMEYMTDLGKHYKKHIPRENWNWETLDDFYDHMFTTGTAVNVVPLVGHSTLRANVMGYENRSPDEQEMKQMKHLLEIELEKGGFGLSSGLIYHPGAFAKAGELAELATVVSSCNGIYSTHMRSEGKFLFKAVEEALSVARESGVSLEISHLKCETPVMWGKGSLLLEKIHQARKEGIQVDFDQYPYTAYSTSLLEIFPFWAKEGGSSRMKDILNNAQTRQKVMADMNSPALDWDNPMEGLDWNAIRIMGYTQPKNMELNGLTVQALAYARNLEPLEAIFQAFCEEKSGLGMIVFAMSEQDLITILQDPQGMIGSDGRSVTPYGPTGKSLVHPRFYGTFPRVLGRYVREKKVISLEQAVHKMTGLPAGKLGLKDRGLIRKGMAADLVLFDPDTIQDMATFDTPHEYPLGIVHVIVNGKSVILNTEHTGKLPGKRLYRDN
jgi:N-acyl-D-amino-acid deacylase